MARLPFRLYIQQKLAEQLKTISLANGYVTDVGDKVYRGIGMFTGDTDQWPLPMVSILEAPKQEEPEHADYQGQVKRVWWQLMVQGWVNDDITNPTDPTHYLAADVEMCLSQIIETDGNGTPTYPDSYLLGLHPADTTGQTRLISGLRYGVPICRPAQAQISAKAFFYLPVWIELAYDSSTSYIDV